MHGAHVSSKVARKRSWVTITVLAFLLVAIFTSVLPAWRTVCSRDSGADFASYYYALQVAVEGANPYDSAALTERARSDRSARRVHPFLYPPPFLLGMLWARHLTLRQAYLAFFWLNQFALVIALALCWAWFRANPALLAFLAATFSPITDHAAMGQVNLLVLIVLMVALWRRSGAFLGTGTMIKFVPALALAWWGSRRQWKPIAVAVAVAVGLSLVTLPLLGLSVQLDYYTRVITTFSSGGYNGLEVPIDIAGNHSLADLLRRFWPGPSHRLLSDTARLASTLVGILLVVALALLTRERRDALGEACGAGAWVTLMVVLPVYAYEHHLVLLLLPAAAAVQAGIAGRLPPVGWVTIIIGYVLLAQPLGFAKHAAALLPHGQWYLESKLLAIALLGGTCAWAHRRSAPRPMG